MMQLEFNFDTRLIIYRVFNFLFVLHVDDVINFVFFCMYAMHIKDKEAVKMYRILSSVTQ
jgi:hypothetical protein